MVKFGPVEVRFSKKDGTEERIKLNLSDISTIFQRIPGATDILEEVYNQQYNRYELFNKMVMRSSDLNTAINKLAMMVHRTYKGLFIHPGDSEEDDEREFLKTVNDDTDHLDIGGKFYSAARRLMIDGDVIINSRIINDKPRWDFLPMMRMTAIRVRGDLKKTFDSNSLIDPTLYSGPPGWYVYDEEGTAQHLYRKTSIMHIPLNNEAENVEDILGRSTWGIWSHSPLESLRPDVYWAMATKVNDMIWRRLYLPREHHEVDVTDLMDLSLYDGETETVRRAAAIAHVTEVIGDYVKRMKGQLPDQGYVTPKVGDVSSVTITIIEPKSTNYVSPNELLQQLSSTISAAYYVRLTNESSASFAAEHIVVSDTQMAAEYLASTIKRYFLNEIKSLYPDNEHVEKLDMRLQLILPKDTESLVREAAVLRAAGIMTVDEIRVRVLGLDPLTDEQREKLEEEGAMNSEANAQTKDQIQEKFITRDPDEEDREETTQSKKANQNT